LEISISEGHATPSQLHDFKGNAAAACLPLLAALARPGAATVRLPLAGRTLQIVKSH
jgi:hypothetical protein